MRITRKQTYSALAGVGILLGTAGLAAAATGGTSTSTDAAAQSPAATAAGPDQTVSGAETDADEGPERDEADETGDETGDESETPYTSSITVADNESGVETDESTQLAGLATISADQASQSALVAQPGTVTDVQLENENGNVVYSVIVDTGNGSFDVKVDAGDGAVLASEADDGNDEGQDGADDEQDDADEAPGSEVADD